jgi:coenzyme PQQ precursor peptide PqqA
MPTSGSIGSNLSCAMQVRKQWWNREAPQAVVTLPIARYHFDASQNRERKLEESLMVWTTPTLVEICIGLEINGYLPAEF